MLELRTGKATLLFAVAFLANLAFQCEAFKFGIHLSPVAVFAAVVTLLASLATAAIAILFLTSIVSVEFVERYGTPILAFATLVPVGAAVVYGIAALTQLVP